MKDAFKISRAAADRSKLRLPGCSLPRNAMKEANKKIARRDGLFGEGNEKPKSKTGEVLQIGQAFLPASLLGEIKFSTEELVYQQGGDVALM